MKRITVILLLVCLLLAGCAKQTPAAESSAAPEAEPSAAAETPAVPESTLSPEEAAALIPAGTWVDEKHPEAQLVIDDKCAGSVSVTAEDGTVTVWTFSGAYDALTGSISYSDCVKQVTAPDGTVTTAYTDGRGGLSCFDGSMFWIDEAENAGADYTFRQVQE